MYQNLWRQMQCTTHIGYGSFLDPFYNPLVYFYLFIYLPPPRALTSPVPRFLCEGGGELYLQLTLRPFPLTSLFGASLRFGVNGGAYFFLAMALLSLLTSRNMKGRNYQGLHQPPSPEHIPFHSSSVHSPYRCRNTSCCLLLR